MTTLCHCEIHLSREDLRWMGAGGLGWIGEGGEGFGAGGGGGGRRHREWREVDKWQPQPGVVSSTLLLIWGWEDRSSTKHTSVEQWPLDLFVYQDYYFSDYHNIIAGVGFLMQLMRFHFQFRWTSNVKKNMRVVYSGPVFITDRNS